MRAQKKQPVVFFCLAIMIALLLATSAEAQKPIKLVCDIWPPYQIKTETGVSGFSVEVVQAVYKQMGVPTGTIRAYPWKRAMAMLKHGDAQALFSANFTLDRQTFAYYPSEVLIESPWVIWTKNSNTVNSLNDLKGKTIGVVSGYSYTPKFWNFIKSHCTVANVNSDRANFKKLSAGRIDATVAEYGNGLHLVAELKDNTLTPNQAVTIKLDGLYLIFNRKNTTEKFVKDFSNALIKFKKTDAHAKLWGKYFNPTQ